MRGVRLLAGLLPAVMWAQLAFYSGEKRIEAVFQAGSAAPGDTLDIPLRLRNVSTGPVIVHTLKVAGTGFTFASEPKLEFSLAPGSYYDFMVRFRPFIAGGHSAVLSTDNTSVILSASSVTAPVLQVDGNFGEVARGAEVARQATVENRGTQPAAVGAVTITGAGFGVRDAPGAGLVLAPGAKVTFTVYCRPTVLGTLAGTLQVGVRRAALSARAVEPPLPPPEIVITLSKAASAQQGKVEIRLASASGTRATGELALDFLPAGGLGADTGVVFSNSTRTANVRVEQGDTAARIADRASIDFQTGSTAGDLRFTLRLGDYNLEKSVTIAPAVVAVNSSNVVRLGSNIDVKVVGLDNSRSVSRLTFTFYDRNNKEVAPGAIRVDAADLFRRYFQEGSGSFLLRASFPVTGSAELLESVETELTNSSGTVRTGRIRF